jgi:hypothetical protein
MSLEVATSHTNLRESSLLNSAVFNTIFQSLQQCGRASILYADRAVVMKFASEIYFSFRPPSGFELISLLARGHPVSWVDKVEFGNLKRSIRSSGVG